MLNRAGYRLHIDGKSDHASWWVGPVVWCRWWIEWGPGRTPVAHHISTRAAQMLISWSELFECDRLDTTGTSPKPCLWYQMMIPVYEVRADVEVNTDHKDIWYCLTPWHACHRARRNKVYCNTHVIYLIYNTHISRWHRFPDIHDLRYHPYFIHMYGMGENN